MSKQFLIGLAAVAAVVVGFIVFGGSDEDVRVVQTSRSSPDGESPEEPFEARQPGSLNLGGQREKPGQPGEDPQRAAEAGRSAEGRDQGSRSKPPRFGGVGGVEGDHGAIDGDAQAGGPEVRSGLADVPGLAGTTGEAANRGGGAVARAPVDDWPEEAVDVVQPGEQREPDAGEVLTLFEGDPALSQAEAAIEEDVKFEEDGAVFSSDSEYAVPMAGRLSGEAGSITFWVRPDGETSDIDNASLVQLRSQNEWANRLQIWKDGSNVRLVFSDGSGVESGASYGGDGWAADEWRMVTATWGEGMTALYVNGQLAGTSQYQSPFTIQPKTMLHVASNYRDDPRSLNGAVNQFRVYNRVLSPDEVSSLSSHYPD
jgi:hypothetical protein